MKYIWEHKWFFVPVAVCWVVGLTAALALPYGDEIHFFNGAREYGWLNTAFVWFTHLGEEWAFLGIGIAVLFWRPKHVALIAVAGLLSMSVGYVFKDLAGVDRPITYFEKTAPAAAQPVLVPGVALNRGQTSFPSGHTTAAFALYSLLALMTAGRWPKMGFWLAVAAILVAVSRIFLVQHFLADVLAGAVLGMALGGVAWRLGALWPKKPVQALPPPKQYPSVVDLAKKDFLPKIASAGQGAEGLAAGNEAYAAAACLVPMLLATLGHRAGDKDFVEKLYADLEAGGTPLAARFFESAFEDKWGFAARAAASFARTSPEAVAQLAPAVARFVVEAMREAIASERLTTDDFPEYLRAQARMAEFLAPAGGRV